MSLPACLSFSRGKGVAGSLVEAVLNLFLDVAVKAGEKAEVPLCRVCTDAVGAAAGETGPVC